MPDALADVLKAVATVLTPSLLLAAACLSGWWRRRTEPTPKNVGPLAPPADRQNGAQR